MWFYFDGRGTPVWLEDDLQVFWQGRVVALGEASASRDVEVSGLPRLSHLTTINPLAAIVNTFPAPGAFEPTSQQHGPGERAFEPTSQQQHHPTARATSPQHHHPTVYRAFDVGGRAFDGGGARPRSPPPPPRGDALLG